MPIRHARQTPTVRYAMLPGMNLSKMTRQEIEALLRLLADWERKEFALLMLERRKTEQDGRLHSQSQPASAGFLFSDWIQSCGLAGPLQGIG